MCTAGVSLHIVSRLQDTRQKKKKAKTGAGWLKNVKKGNTFKLELAFWKGRISRMPSSCNDLAVLLTWMTTRGIGGSRSNSSNSAAVHLGHKLTAVIKRHCPRQPASGPPWYPTRWYCVSKGLNPKPLTSKVSYYFDHSANASRSYNSK